MVLKKFTFLVGKKKVSIKVKECKSIWSKFSGLMFRTKSKPLLFVFGKEKKLSIHSFFCKSFIAIWIDENLKAKKSVAVNQWKTNFSGFGQYLLEVPKSDENYLKMTKALKISDGQKKKGLNIKSPSTNYSYTKRR